MLLNSTRGFPIFADDETALGTGLAGLTITVSLRKNGGSQNAVSPTITDLGDGVYWIEPIAAHRDTLGFNVWKFSATGAVIAPVFEEVVAVDNQVATQPVNVTQISGDSTAADTLELFVEALDQVTGQIDSGTLADNTLTAAALAADAVAEIAAATSVTVLPATGIAADRSEGVTLRPVVGETISQSITVYQSDGTTAVDLSGKTLAVVFETMGGTDVAVVPDADITVSGADDNVVTFAYPVAVTASERTLKFALRDAAAPLTMYLQGVCSVTRAPQVD